jgi:hypothetical protein
LHGAEKVKVDDEWGGTVLLDEEAFGKQQFSSTAVFEHLVASLVSFAILSYSSLSLWICLSYHFTSLNNLRKSMKVGFLFTFSAEIFFESLTSIPTPIC